jgi:Tol biopolymer transport system component
MPLNAGDRLGPYQIIAPAGAGGMGDVYRARDVRLDREVAVKTVRGPFTDRFEREARAISSFNHPNICTLYDVGEHEGSGYLVMEYIDGKPVQGPLPVDEALTLGIQICEALSAAHRKGIVHRDLKPANILITKQGIKLLDFGLAKLSSPGESAAAASVSSSGEQRTMAALTGAHTVVGTPQYMAPEQISGGEVDARTDIFAFGCVLYEILTGRPAFEGKNASSVMAAVLATNPAPVETLVPAAPPALDRVITRCLVKDPDDRWQSARDVMAELQWIAQGGSRVGLPAVVSVRRRTREALAWSAAALAAIVAIAFMLLWMRRAPVPAAVVRFPLPVPEGLGSPTSPEVSPDGRKVAFVATDRDGKSVVWLRPLDVLEPRPLPGTEGASRLFWSPDSRMLAFSGGGKLRKVDITGGPAQTICESPNASDGSWSPAGIILFDGRGNDPIWEVPAAGGVPKVKVGSNAGDKPGTSTGWPVFLPDGRHFLYMVFGDGADQTLMVGSLDSADVKTLFKTTSRVVYAAPGYLLFVRENTLVAQPFDLKKLATTGEAVPVGEGLGVDSVGLASFSVSTTGVLAYRAGDLTGQRLLWVDRSGKQTPAIDAVSDYRDVTFSPDGKRFAYDQAGASSKGDIWIFDMIRKVNTRFTFDSVQALAPVWSADGRTILFTSRAKSPGDLMIKDVSGTREPEPLLVSADAKYASDWSRDGKYVLYSSAGKDTGWDDWAVPTAGDRKPFPIAQSRFDELFARFSPDGKYVAYYSNQSGRYEVYVQEFPEPHNRWQISTNGGTEPSWRQDGKEMFYRSGQRVMAVPVQWSPEFTVGTPVELFQAPVAAGITTRARYQPAADGQRFLVLASRGRDAVQPASVVLNWTEALSAR